MRCQNIGFAFLLRSGFPLLDYWNDFFRPCANHTVFAFHNHAGPTLELDSAVPHAQIASSKERMYYRYEMVKVTMRLFQEILNMQTLSGEKVDYIHMASDKCLPIAPRARFDPHLAPGTSYVPRMHVLAHSNDKFMKSSQWGTFHVDDVRYLVENAEDVHKRWGPEDALGFVRMRGRYWAAHDEVVFPTELSRRGAGRHSNQGFVCFLWCRKTACTLTAKQVRGLEHLNKNQVQNLHMSTDHCVFVRKVKPEEARLWHELRHNRSNASGWIKHPAAKRGPALRKPRNATVAPHLAATHE